MQEVVMSLDVMCAWEITPPAYRLYVDNDLLTERSYIWNNNEQFVRENIIVNLEPGIHTLRIEPVNPEFGGFSNRNFTVNSQPAALVNNQFIIQ